MSWIETVKGGAKSLLGKDLSRAVSSKAASAVSGMPSYAKGGVVKKTGPARVHKGERVLTVKQHAALKKMLK